MKIALHGKACAGKSFVAQILHERHNFNVVSFAEPIRDAVILSKRYLAHGVSVAEMGDFLLGLTDEETARRMLHEWYGMVSRHTDVLLTDQKPRGFMQEFGTVFRIFDQSVFIRAALEEADDDCCIDDLRLKDEAWRLADEEWLLVKIWCAELDRNDRARQNYPESQHLLNHHTETDMDDWTAWDGTLCTSRPKEEMPNRVRLLLEELQSLNAGKSGLCIGDVGG